MEKNEKKWKDLPLWLINWITVISGVVTILGSSAAFVLPFFFKFSLTVWYIVLVFVLLFFLIIVFLRMRKYAQIEVKRMKTISYHYHQFLHRSKDLFFDTMHSHKTDSLTEKSLTESCKLNLTIMLDDLCNVMNSYTEQKISACIKLISYPKEEEVIDKDNATLVTFCRSSKSDFGRSDYEKQSQSEIFIKDNTDFFEIIDDNKRYFYQGNLEKYDEKLKEVGLKYRNSNDFWYKYYKGTIVVPIKIEFDKLYHQKENNAYHIIGFLCVDSLSTDAFEERQEKYNVDILLSFADVVYVLLGQYRHYLKKFAMRH